MIGQTLGHYRILEELGRGGMGEVYLAEDLRLKRQIALKILPEDLSSIPGRMRRFQREAEVLATLRHPGIVTIYSLEEVDDRRFLTMEYIEGQPLLQVIPEQGLLVEEFFRLAIPLADAVSAAHDRGVLHRDLKPNNVMVTDEGEVKVLDFGLAKLREVESGDVPSEVSTDFLTDEGHRLGTLPYMSPEQVRGDSVDHRSDIFAVGVVLYEMACGVYPFDRSSNAELASSILRDPARAVDEVRESLPHHLGRIISHCLEKDPERRLQSAKDLRNELQALESEWRVSDQLTTGRTFRENARTKGRRLRLAGWGGLIVVLGVAFYFLMLESGGVRQDAAKRLEFTLKQITDEQGAELFPSLSPDGSFVVYSAVEGGDWDLFLRRVGGRNVVNLTGDSPADDSQPMFSPDGSLIAFRSERDGGGIYLMGATGEDVRRLVDFGFNPAWVADGSELVVATEGVSSADVRASISELWIVNAATGERRRLIATDAVQPSVSPNGRRVAYWATVDFTGERNIFTLDLESGDSVALTAGPSVDWNPVWSPDGGKIFFSSDRGGPMNIWRISVDERSGLALGEPQPVTSGVSFSNQHLTVSQDGRRLAFVSQVTTKNLFRVRFDPEAGAVLGEPVPVTEGSVQAHSPDPSPDGSWVAFNSWGGQEDIFVANTNSRELRQLTDDAHKDRSPRWSPDGRRIAFYSNRSGHFNIWMINSDGSGLQQVTDSKGISFPIWSPDGTRLAFPSAAGAAIINLQDTDDVRVPLPLPARDAQQGQIVPWSWSPDGRLLAGIRRFDDGHSGGVLVYSLKSETYDTLSDFGEFPTWLADSRSILFSNEGKIYVVDLESRSPRPVFSLADADIHRVFSYSQTTQYIFFAQIATEADIWMLQFED